MTDDLEPAVDPNQLELLRDVPLEALEVEVDDVEPRSWDLDPPTPIADLLGLTRQYSSTVWAEAAARAAYPATADACRALAWLRNGLDTLEPLDPKGDR